MSSGIIVQGQNFPLTLNLGGPSASGFVGSLQVYIAKNGGSFNIPLGAVSDIGFGFYQVAGNSTDSGSPGSLVVYGSLYTLPNTAFTLSQVGGGTLPSRTEIYALTYVGPQGETGGQSITYTPAANNLVQISSPPKIYNYTGYNVYGVTTSGSLTLQNTLPVALGTSWLEPTGGLTTSGAILAQQPPTVSDTVVYSVLPQNQSGTGPLTVTVNVTDNYYPPNPLQSASVSFTINNNSYQAVTNASGTGTLNLTSGTYTVAATLDGYSYNGTTVSVQGNMSLTIVMTPVTSVIPPAPNMCAVSYLATSASGQPQAGVTITYQIVQPPIQSTGYVYAGVVQTSQPSNSAGIITILLPQSSYVSFNVGSGTSQTVQIPNLPNASLNSLLSA